LAIPKSGSPMPTQNSSIEADTGGFKAVDEAALALQSAADETVDLVRSVEETAEKTADTVADGAIKAVELGVDLERELGDRGREVADQTEARSFAAEVVELTREGLAKQAEAARRLFSCRSPQDLIKLQVQLAQEGMASTADAAKRLSAATLRDVGKFAKPITARAQ
jgi:hypothetical protein